MVTVDAHVVYCTATREMAGSARRGCEGRLYALGPMFKSHLDAQQRGDFITCNQQQLAHKIGEGRLAGQSVHVWVQVPLPKECGCELGDDEGDGDLVRRGQSGVFYK